MIIDIMRSITDDAGSRGITDMEIELLGGNYGELELDGDITWTFLISNRGNDVDRAFLTLHEEGEDGIEVLGNSQPLPGFVISFLVFF